MLNPEDTETLRVGILDPADSAGLEVERLPARGEASTQRGADRIAQGTHGRSGCRRLALASVADRVIRAADIPALLARNPSEARIAALPWEGSWARPETPKRRN